MTENRKRANDFRYVYANGTKMTFSNQEVVFWFGIREEPNAPEEAMREEMAVVMSPTSAKVLATVLTRTIAHFEKTTGMTIAFDSAKLDNLEQTFEEQSKKGG